MVISRPLRRVLDRGANALIRPAAADVAVHRLIDVVVARTLGLFQQRRGLHDLASLAIAALRHVGGAPRLLHRMIALRIEALDRRHRAAIDIAHGGDARAYRVAVEMNRAGAT